MLLACCNGFLSQVNAQAQGALIQPQSIPGFRKRVWTSMMNHKRAYLVFLVFLLALVACSVELTEQRTPTVTTVVPVTNGTPTVAPAWADLNVSGRLLFLVSTPPENQTELVQLNLLSGVQTTIFRASRRALLTAFAVSPDNRTIVLAYQPPAPEGFTATGSSGLYVMPVAGSATPTPVLADETGQEAFFAPAWSPDGRYIYYSVYKRVEPANGIGYIYNLERVRYPDGGRELLVESALWPNLSPDGRWLAYLSFAPSTLENHLFLAEPDGDNARLVMPPRSFLAVDAHFFSADSTMLYFSAVTESAPQGLSWLDRLLGVKAAAGHTVPSDWWRVPIDGGPPERLTNIGEIGLYADIAPDGAHIAFLSSNGVFVMQPDGSELRRLLEVPAFSTLNWLP